MAPDATKPQQQLEFHGLSHSHEYTTLEVGGDENVLASMKFLVSLGI